MKNTVRGAAFKALAETMTANHTDDWRKLREYSNPRTVTNTQLEAYLFGILDFHEHSKNPLVESV